MIQTLNRQYSPRFLVLFLIVSIEIDSPCQHPAPFQATEHVCSLKFIVFASDQGNIDYIQHFYRHPPNLLQL